MTSSTGSISPMTSPMESDESRTWIEPQQQLSAYMAWINSQLKKKPGTHLIEDLRNDMRDGVVFADVIEIVSKQKIEGIHNVPATFEEMRSNIDLVLQFMMRNRIRMHRISSRDIVEGNLKAVMRLILALAAHYKPMSVRHSANASITRANNKTTNQSVMDIAQGASAALTEARRNAKKAGKRYPRSRNDSRYHESSSEPCSDSDQSYLRADWRVSQSGLHERRELEGCSAGSSPASSCRASLQFQDDSPGVAGIERRKSATLETVGKDGNDSVDSGMVLDDSQVLAVKDMKKQLMQLQDLILANSPDSAVDLSFEPSTPEGTVLLRSQLQHSNLINQELREELTRMKNECLQLQGTKGGLLQRLSEQDVLLSQLKSDKLNLEIELQTVTAENVSLRKELTHQVDALKSELGQAVGNRDQTITNLRRELTRRDQMIDKLQQEVKRLSRSSGDSHLSQPQSAPHNQKPPASKRISELGERMKPAGAPNGNTPQAWKSQQMAAEVSFLQDSLNDMQSMLSVPATHPPPLDKLEMSIIGLLQNLRASRHPGHLDGSRCSLLNESSVDGRKPADNKTPVPKLRPSALQHVRKVTRPSAGGQAGDGPSTSVIFFTDHSIQPNTCVMPGKLGEIRLKDFKNLFEDSEHYRYYFKALDPEYGTVKEELTKDEALIPGWEDKIVAWVETETGTPC
ncbi:hypothetical protein V1264_016718 [Littorina saxatilis]|uniref:Dixin-like n=2 Tax=Littorina saxatilis TaxID=31220 RepID=A0AAN9GDT0_9CAEN